MMKTSDRYLIICCLGTLCLGSCSEDFLYTPPTGAFTEDNYIRNLAELETILYSCYSVLNTYALGDMAIGLGTGNVGSDDALKGGAGPSDLAFMNDISLSRQLPSNEGVKSTWSINYDLIGKCNLVIDKAEELEVAEDELDELESIADQARFLRALGYYNLVTLFGDVPKVIHWQDNLNDLNFYRSPAGEIWDQIEQDLHEAADLPLRSETLPGRVTHGAVHALLGKTHMFQHEYKEAAEAYRAVIESNEYELLTDYGKIFRYEEGENCIESVFEFQEEMGVDGGHMSTANSLFRMPWEGGGFGFDIPTQDLVDEFEPGDPRLLYTVIFTGDVFPAPPPWGPGEVTIWNGASTTGYSTRKTWIPFDERSIDSWLQAYNLRYCRYAEVLLFCAEALNELGEDVEAREYLNMVRERARNTSKIDPQRISTVWDGSYEGELLPDVTTGDRDELREAIWHEQRVELAQEQHRRWILLRTGRFKERMEAVKGHLGCTVEEHELLFPIPGEEVRLSQGRITQNPGYN